MTKIGGFSVHLAAKWGPTMTKIDGRTANSYIRHAREMPLFLPGAGAEQPPWRQKGSLASFQSRQSKLS